MPFVSIGGVTLHYRHLTAPGDARPIVFINSLGTDFRVWSAITRGFAAHPTLVYDKRGHGLSDLGDTPYSMEDHVDDLIGLVEHLGLKHLVLCGLSVGGLIAQGFHDRRPDLVDGIILCDTAHKIGTDESWNARIAAVEQNGIGSIADGVMKMWFTPAFHEKKAAELAGYRNMVSRQSLQGYVATCAAIRDVDYTEAARRIAVPVLCVVGDQDGSTPPDLVRSTAELIPRARFEIIKDAGHIPCVEQPAALTKLIQGFIAALPPRETADGPRQ